MSQAVTVARPYARAAFAIAKDSHQQQIWSRALTISSQIARHRQVIALLINPVLSHAQKVQLVQVEEAGPVYQRFLATLSDLGRLVLLPEISEVFHRLWAEAEQMVQAKVTAPHPLSSEQEQRLLASLKKRFNCEIELKTVVDPSLLGGAVIEANGVVIDGSAHGKLVLLQELFASSSF